MIARRMDLVTYIRAKHGRAAALAEAVGVRAVMVSQWAAGTKPVAAERCTPIEFATGRAVRRWDLRPADWHRIWPELIGAEGAPPVRGELLKLAA
jgi:DNA-binding transcriptional regulator YdaS (Cro superfamily)